MANTFNKNMKVYIPLMNTYWANEDRIKEVFRKDQLGEVKKVKIVRKISTKKETGYIHSAFVDLEWYQNEHSEKMQRIMNAPGIVSESKLMIDDKWYFLLLNSSNRR